VEELRAHREVGVDDDDEVFSSPRLGRTTYRKPYRPARSRTLSRAESSST
jgi:hypothetical protein